MRTNSQIGWFGWLIALMAARWREVEIPPEAKVERESDKTRRQRRARLRADRFQGAQ
jgi:hypothetical protein